MDEHPNRRILRLCLLPVLGFAAGTVLVLGLRLELHRRGLSLSPEAAVAAQHALYFHLALAVVAGALLLVRNRAWARHPLAPRLALASVPLLALASADRVLAIYFEPVRDTGDLNMPHPTRGWTSRPGWTGGGPEAQVRINQYGLRGPAVPLEKSPGQHRILFLGDSVVFGWRTREEDALVGRVRRLAVAQEDNPHVTLINCATQGYSPWQEYDLLVNDCMRFRPDAIVQVFCLNDVLEKFQLDRFGGYSRGLGGETPSVLEWSGLYRAIRAIKTRLGQPSQEEVLRQQRRFSTRRLLRDPHAEDVQHGWEVTLANMKKIVAAAREQATPIVIICLPDLDQLTPDAPPGPAPQDVVAAFARNQGVPYLDLLPVFRAHLDSTGVDPATLFLDPIHLSPAGYAVAADAIYRFLLENGLLAF